VFLLTSALPGAINRITTLMFEAANFFEMDSHLNSNRWLFPETALAETLMLRWLMRADVRWRDAAHLLRR
jgi:hypothetical protein